MLDVFFFFLAFEKGFFFLVGVHNIHLGFESVRGFGGGGNTALGEVKGEGGFLSKCYVPNYDWESYCFEPYCFEAQ